ncbi:hypothetical protein AC578_1405 [Pseudocercospora eumusae]|uniref:Adenosine deaminase n=1 Tax=Pseudocercospora eumusae TaxID=321146 RepID=A0A139HUC5_9PEZI|nr:hypothetical protein AC578_1405 [Pseudocercospora eumusae]
MANVANALPITNRLKLRESLKTTSDSFLLNLPKIELHVHIEGCLTPELKWKFSQRNKTPILNARTGEKFKTLEQLQNSHNNNNNNEEKMMTNAEETLTFFEMYTSGFAILETQRDYYDLAMEYFTKASAQKIVYAEIFFDAQGHKGKGKGKEMMEGFREASIEAAKKEGLNVKSSWILCFLRDESPEAAMECYETFALGEYRDMVLGVGLDSNEEGRAPNLFRGVFERARRDGFRVTCHCDVGKAYPVEHVRQVVEDIEADRIDHGLNVVEDERLMGVMREKGLGMTICPWSYIRHQPFEQVFERIRVLIDNGLKISIGSDDPAFMEDAGILENLRVLKKYCKLTNEDMVQLSKGAVEISWAPPDLKKELLGQLDKVAIAP